MLLGSVTQQPAELQSYTVSYSDALHEGDTIDSVETLVEPEGLTIDRAVSLTDSVRLWLTGGLSPTRYKVTIRATTAEGRIYEDELYVMVREV